MKMNIKKIINFNIKQKYQMKLNIHRFNYNKKDKDY